MSFARLGFGKMGAILYSTYLCMYLCKCSLIVKVQNNGEPKRGPKSVQNEFTEFSHFQTCN